MALMGVGGGLGFPLPLVAGAVLSGAYFGDKMSPLSDTTNMAPAMAGGELFSHIKHMSYTTGVSITLTLIIEAVLGMRYSNSGANLEQIEKFLATLQENFTINPVLLLPLLVVLVVSFKKVPAIPGIALGAVAGAICAVGLQGATYETIATAALVDFQPIPACPKWMICCRAVGWTA